MQPDLVLPPQKSAAPKSPKPCLLKTQTLCSALPFLVLLSGQLTIMMIMNDDPGWDLVDQAEYHEDTDDEKLYIVLPTVQYVQGVSKKNCAQ